MRASIVLLGLALAILVAVGFEREVTPQLLHLQLGVALLSIVTFFLPDGLGRAIHAGTVALGLLLLAGDAAGLVSGVAAWSCWAGLGFGFAYLALDVSHEPAAESVRRPLAARRT